MVVTLERMTNNQLGEANTDNSGSLIKSSPPSLELVPYSGTPGGGSVTDLKNFQSLFHQWGVEGQTFEDYCATVTTIRINDMTGHLATNLFIDRENPKFLFQNNVSTITWILFKLTLISDATAISLEGYYTGHGMHVKTVLSSKPLYLSDMIFTNYRYS